MNACTCTSGPFTASGSSLPGKIHHGWMVPSGFAKRVVSMYVFYLKYLLLVSGAGVSRPSIYIAACTQEQLFFFFFKLREKAAQYSLSYGLENIELFLKYNFPTSLPKIVKCIFSSCNLTPENAHL